MGAFEVRRDDIRTTRVVAQPEEQADEGQALLRVDLFALTTNNVTYATTGDQLGYWGFFPSSEEGWGRVPVWGFADVVASEVAGVEAGQRVYGFLPPAGTVTLTPTRATAAGFVDGSAHRAALPAVYNRYELVDPTDDESVQALLRPLFTTSFLLDDWLAANAMFGAGAVVLSSASSKTALGLAALLARRDGVEVVGLTSAGNAPFVAGLGTYDHVVVYGDVDALPPGPAAFVDMAGDPGVRAAVHQRYGEDLVSSTAVGFTHHEAAPAAPARLPGARPTFFFAPDHIRTRTRERGPSWLAEGVAAAWATFAPGVGRWLEVVEGRGGDAIAGAWEELVAGRTPPARGHVLRP